MLIVSLDSSLLRNLQGIPAELDQPAPPAPAAAPVAPSTPSGAAAAPAAAPAPVPAAAPAALAPGGQPENLFAVRSSFPHVPVLPFSSQRSRPLELTFASHL